MDLLSICFCIMYFLNGVSEGWIKLVVLTPKTASENRNKCNLL